MTALPRLYFHPFAQYCQKVLIALYERQVAFDPVRINLGDPDSRAKLARVWPFAKFPALDTGDGTILGESGVIIDYLDTLSPDRAPMVPADRRAALEPRMLERVLDHHVADPLTRIVVGRFTGKPADEAAERASIATAYAFLEARLPGRAWGAGDAFGLADCAAAPALFYANLVEPFGDRPLLAAWFARLRARPAIARVIDEARPYRAGTPFDWPADY